MLLGGSTNCYTRKSSLKLAEFLPGSLIQTLSSYFSKENVLDCSYSLHGETYAYL